MRCSGSRTVGVLLITSIFGIAFFWKFFYHFGRGRQQTILEYRISLGDGGGSGGKDGDAATLANSRNCTVDTCLDLLPCSLHDDRLTVFVEPLIRVFGEDGNEITPSPSREFLTMRTTIERTRYAVDSVEDACLVVPGFDMLNIYRYDDGYRTIRDILDASGHRNNRNMLLFVFAGANLLDIKAITARTESHRPIFRRGFDVSLPLWDPYAVSSLPAIVASSNDFAFFIVVPVKLASSHNVKTLLKNLFNKKNCLILDTCNDNGDDGTNENVLCDSYGRVQNLEATVKKSEFTLIDDRVGGYELLLMTALRFGSIPVIISDTFIPPFNEVIDWNLLSLTFFHNRLSSVLTVLRMLSSERKQRMREQGSFIYYRYFSSLEKIILATLGILERRIITNSFTTYDDWNCNSQKHCLAPPPPLFLPHHVPADGFTGVILAYNKPESLFAVIRLLAKVPSLRSIVVVWNNPNEPPPAVTEWPHISRPIRVIQMDQNALSNRFIMFPEITTEAVFSLDDDITALNVDEIEFAYQTWRENPDRLVGFLPREAVFNVTTKLYEYHTEWTNSMNIILTGASFYHKYYGTLYHEILPREMISYVEKNKNCEDIAMNFLISSITRKSPLKVTPRKKFVCPKCDNNGISAWDIPRLLQRSACINTFVEYFGYNPLMSSVSRYDPVLYRVSSEDVTNPYAQIGPL